MLETTKNRKAVDTDNLNSDLLKYRAALLHAQLLYLFKMWNTYRLAKIISIFKKGDRNYRGISLLNCAYKIYSKIINRMTIMNSLILGEQSGL